MYRKTRKGTKDCKIYIQFLSCSIKPTAHCHSTKPDSSKFRIALYWHDPEGFLLITFKSVAPVLLLFRPWSVQVGSWTTSCWCNIGGSAVSPDVAI